MSDLLSHLNEEQQKVVQATEGPVLVLAGAGSGKTRALTHRIAYLLHSELAQPHEILAVTFTNKAAKEMKHRVAELVGSKFNTPAALGTFHSLGAKLLREQAQHLPRTPGFTICDSSDSERLIRQAMQEQGLSSREWNPRNLRNSISKAKSALLKPSDIASVAHSPSDEVLAKVYARYEALLAKNDSYDFDDLLTKPLELLDQNEEIRKQYQNKWKYLSVDEYQDTNPTQDKLLQLLMGPEKNICVVGDDYQAIYSWRGAKVDHILRFESRFPGCTTIYLTQNYRSTPSILEAANQIIAENTAQKHKKLWTSEKEGDPVRLVALSSDRDEARWVRTKIEEHVRTGGRLRDCLVLYRTNAQSRSFEEEFLTHNVPYSIVGGFRFYDRKEIKDAVAFLQFWTNPQSSLGIRRIAETLWRGVGPKTLVKWEEEANEAGITLEKYISQRSLAQSTLQAVAHAYANARSKTYTSVSDLLKSLLQTSGYLTYLKAQPDGEERQENIDELLNVTAAYADVNIFLENVALLSDIDTYEEQQDRVTCMTLHASKGLEFPYVFLVGCEDGLLPHLNSLDSKASLEEERRLLYVGITRAKQKLILTYALSRFVHGEWLPQMPSRFLDALPHSVERYTSDSQPITQEQGEPAIIEVEEGDMVYHPIMGRGVVIELQGSIANCIFEGHGLKAVDATILKQHQI